MSTLRLSAATGLGVLLCASTAFAQETTTTAPVQESQTTTTTVAPAPAPAPAPVQVTAPPPVQATSTTTTTASPWGPTPTDTTTERTIEHRPNRALLSTGAGIFVLSYGSSVIAGAVSDRESDKRLFIPVVGPWLDLGQRDCNAATPCGSNEDLAKAMVITSGAVQGVGVLMALSSLVIPESTTVEERTHSAKSKFFVAPVSYQAGAGVGAVGTF